MDAALVTTSQDGVDDRTIDTSNACAKNSQDGQGFFDGIETYGASDINMLKAGQSPYTTVRPRPWGDGTARTQRARFTPRRVVID
jgi:hypothetical protein